MPAKSLDMYFMQESRNNFDAMRPAPICNDASQASVGQCQQIHISTNCYYGYHELKSTHTSQSFDNDCEMMNEPTEKLNLLPCSLNNGRKRNGPEESPPPCKKAREEKRERSNERETTERTSEDKKCEDLLESLFWNTHGGNIYHLVQCL